MFDTNVKKFQLQYSFLNCVQTHVKQAWSNSTKKQNKWNVSLPLNCRQIVRPDIFGITSTSSTPTPTADSKFHYRDCDSKHVRLAVCSLQQFNLIFTMKITISNSKLCDFLSWHSFACPYPRHRSLLFRTLVYWERLIQSRRFCFIFTL